MHLNWLLLLLPTVSKLDCMAKIDYDKVFQFSKNLDLYHVKSYFKATNYQLNVTNKNTHLVYETYMHSNLQW